MRPSCNGCRVLRKGCGDDCCIRPCLHWIASHESQANATLFLAKFYGRAGLLNLLLAAPERHRPGVFRSLLYEACGRIVNPTYGAVGLLWSGSWQHCQAAVDAVLEGSPILQMSSETAAAAVPPLRASDIRHVSKDDAAVIDLRGVPAGGRARFKRAGVPRWGQFFVPASRTYDDDDEDEEEDESMMTAERWDVSGEVDGGEVNVKLELSLCL